MIFNRNPYDGTDVTWDGLRLGKKLLKLQIEMIILLMNDAVDLARNAAKPPGGYFILRND
ncbi:MAG: hypothetical protein ABII27_07410 [bacterium]